MISEEQSSPVSVSDTSAEEQVEDSQLDETMNDNPEQTSDTVLSAPSGNDFKTIDYKWCHTYASQVGNAQIVSKTKTFDQSLVPLGV